jgi:hypothetical protein
MLTKYGNMVSVARKTKKVFQMSFCLDMTGWQPHGKPLCLSARPKLSIHSSVHLIDVFINLGFLGVLLNYLLDPPNRVVIDQGYIRNFGFRGILLCVYAAAFLTFKRGLQGIPFSILLLAFIMAVPAVPIPGDGTFDLLLLAFILHVLLLHVPNLPSLVLLFNPEETLPLTVLLWKSFTQTWLPIIGFFLPAMFLAINLLSISLLDVFLQQVISAARVLPQAPIETRAAFFILYLIILLLVMSSIIMMVLVFPSTQLHKPLGSNRWDRYGEAVGLEARQVFMHSVLAYQSRPHTGYPFPTPLNLIVLLLVDLPIKMMDLGGWDARDIRRRGEQTLWRLMVVPFTVIPTLTAWMLGRDRTRV